MRYIGNKTKLLDEISSFIKENIKEEIKIFCDLFSGTGSVSAEYKDKYYIIANDFLRLSYTLTRANVNSKMFYKFKNLGFDPFEYLNTDKYTKGFFYENYSPSGKSGRMYFSSDNAKKIDFIRTEIEKWKTNNLIDDDEYYYLLLSLLESVSLRANVAGVYGSYLKKWDSRALKELRILPVIITKSPKYENEIYNEDSLELITRIKGDLLYLDPPYSRNDYSTQYHLLETLVRYDEPEVTGITGTRKDKIKSSFSDMVSAQRDLEKIISEADFKYIILSYNNNGILSEDYIETLLKRHAIRFQKREIKYNNYTNKKSLRHIKNQEYLYFIEKTKKHFVESPLNYMGSKYNVLNEILPYLNGFNNVIDLFAGGFNVGVNTSAINVTYNDVNKYVKEMVEVFKNSEITELVKYINKRISEYGLEKGNKENYLSFRAMYNNIPVNKRNVLDLFILSQFGFQQQIRFNNNHDFNNPIGMSAYNTNTLIKIFEFHRELVKKNVDFRSVNFSTFEIKNCNDLVVYMDPPYLITLGSYNDGKRGFGGWDEEIEQELYSFIDKLNSENCPFVLSNVIEFKNLKNHILSEWLSKNEYNVKEYIFRKRKEVLVTNFKI